MKITMDYETFSECSIKDCGMWVYSEHPSTDINCCSFQVDEDPPVFWLPPWAFGLVGDQSGLVDDSFVAEIIESAETIEAHNSGFEACIWLNVATPKYGWPVFPAHKMRCSAAKAAMHSLPRGLDQACRALGLSQQKDKDGYKLMLAMCQPTRNGSRIKDAASLLRLVEYCKQDVVAEHGLSKALDDLPPTELAIWQLDQTINARGLQVDLPSARRMVAEIEVLEAMLLERVAKLTDYKVRSARQRDASLRWLAENLCPLKDLTAATVDAALAREDLPSRAREFLQLRKSVAKSSTSKYKALLERTCMDGRLRGSLMYHGASTGRWTGSGFQPQNLPRGSFSDSDACIDALNAGGFDLVDLLWGDPMEAASTCVRGMIIAKPGHDLVVADFSSIEARVVAWMAGEQSILDSFVNGLDLYKVAAQGIYNKDYSEITKEERQAGKTVILACGYQGHIDAFQSMASKFGLILEDDVVGDIVDAWRKANPAIPALWKGLQEASIEAVLDRGVTTSYRDVDFQVVGRFLRMRLPSGRRLYYCDPQLSSETIWRWQTIKEDGSEGRPIRAMKEDKAVAEKAARLTAAKRKVILTGEPEQFKQNVLTYQTLNSMTKQFGKTATYGGKLTENAVQAVSRDLMAEAMLRVEKAGYPVVLTVHDEIVSEVPLGFGSVKEFEELMSVVPHWAAGCPIKAEGWRGSRYRK